MNSDEKTAVVLLGHGSRVPDAAEAMEQVAAKLRQRYPIVETCSMSLRGPLLPEALAKCVRLGVSKIVVIPYFLHQGMHLHVDIPAMMQEAARDCPHVKLVLGKHLGFDESLVNLVARRIEESEGLNDVRDLKLRAEEELVECAPDAGFQSQPQR
ncbi:MAG: CbiX/SirB N-terminal domain-containing protein [Planctomycetes bacterium]|nr:CbiX/SirB N-terminal domain-containing protein [Planctomycetota bacterium]